MKKIVLISHSSNLTGGGEDDFQNLLEHIHQKYEVITIYPSGPRAETYKRYSSNQLEIKGSIFPFTSFNILKYLSFLRFNFKKPFIIYKFLKKAGKIDLCYINSSVCFLETIPIVFLKIPYILSIKEKINPYLVRKIIFRFYGKSSAKIFTISAYLQKDIIKLSKRKDIDLIYSKIKEKEFDDILKKLPKSNKNNNDCFRVLNIGSIYKEKGQDTIVKAISNYKSGDIMVELAGKIIDEAYFKSIMQFINDKGLSGVVKYIGEKSKEQIIEKINECDCVVITSKEEGQSLVVLEAMYMGKPVISTKVGISLEIINNSINGFLFNYKDSNHLLELLLKLKNNKELFSKISVESKNTYNKYFAPIDSLEKASILIKNAINNNSK